MPWSFSEEAAAVKYAAQLQHDMWVVATKTAVLSVITGGGKWVEISLGCSGTRDSDIPCRRGYSTCQYAPGNGLDPSGGRPG